MRAEWDIDDAVLLGFEIGSRDGRFITQLVELGVPLVRLECCVVEEEVGVVDGDGVAGGGQGEAYVCVDGFFFVIESPEVLDELGGLGFGARWGGI